MNLESDKRLNIQLRLDFSSTPKGEARQAGREDIESLSVVSEPERPANTSRIMEEICERANLKEALRQVRGNKGSAGVDRMTVDQLGDYLKQHWPVIREQLLNGTYEPKPVRRVEIPKPDGGGVRKLGIPTVLDRFIQQAVMQVLQRQWNPTFSPYSYGFRPKRSAHQAVAQAQQYIVQGYGWVIDLDLEKFFDRVNHDKLMGQIAKRVEDKRLLKLVRAFLNAGVMENGLVSPSVEGTPQGGPLTPLTQKVTCVAWRLTTFGARGRPTAFSWFGWSWNRVSDDNRVIVHQDLLHQESHNALTLPNLQRFCVSVVVQGSLSPFLLVADTQRGWQVGSQSHLVRC